MFGLFKNNKKKIDIAYLRKQAEKNDRDAQCQLGLAYYRGTKVKKDLQKAHYWMERSNA